AATRPPHGWSSRGHVGRRRALRPGAGGRTGGRAAGARGGRVALRGRGRGAAATRRLPQRGVGPAGGGSDPRRHDRRHRHRLRRVGGRRVPALGAALDADRHARRRLFLGVPLGRGAARVLVLDVHLRSARLFAPRAGRRALRGDAPGDRRVGRRGEQQWRPGGGRARQAFSRGRHHQRPAHHERPSDLRPPAPGAARRILPGKRGRWARRFRHPSGGLPGVRPSGEAQAHPRDRRNGHRSALLRL
ncbi:MAG: hypothetical protein AVDCRST_MAG04-1352, partial [uncultured Acetobacteraceae bacterium]